jgi:medium-chain acyl-[acyl-carrier-protein] hydrolase
MTSSCDVVAVCPPGRGVAITQQLVPSITGVAEQFLQAAKPHRLRRFALFGHSLGGLVAYEVARILQHTGERAPEFLAVSATPCPTVPPLEPLHELTDEALVRHLIEVGDAPPSLALPEIRALFLPVLRNDLGAGHAFHKPAHPKLSTPIYAFWGANDRRVARSAVEAREMPGGHLFVESAGQQLVSALEAAFGFRSTR